MLRRLLLPALLLGLASLSACKGARAANSCEVNFDCAVPGTRCNLETKQCVCSTDEACKEGDFCNSAGVCQTRAGCTQNSDCGAGTYCSGAACVPLTPCGTAELLRSSVGCDFWAVKVELMSGTEGACFAAFIANAGEMPVHIGVEYGQKTMRRTLSRNPDRLKLVLVKGMLGVLAAVLLTTLATVVATPLFVIASAGHELKVTAPELLRAGLGSLVNNMMVVLIALSLGLLTRSMAGGMALPLGYFFVIDTLLAEIPFIGPYMFGAASSEVFSNISGDRFTEGISALGPVLAAVMTIAWAAAFLTAASVRFTRADVE